MDVPLETFFFCQILKAYLWLIYRKRVEFIVYTFIFEFGNIHVLRNHKGGREGVSQMLTFAYAGGGGGQESCLRHHILEKFALRALSVFGVKNNHFQSEISNFYI